MRSISKRFKEREEYYRETSVRPLTPSSVQLKALDDEVAEKLATNKLVQDDFREVDPYQGMFTWQRFIKKYLILPKGLSCFFGIL